MFEYILMLAFGITLLRSILGTTFGDRIIAVNALTYLAVLLMAIYALETENYFLLDIGIVAVILSFIGTLSIAKYLSKEERKK